MLEPIPPLVPLDSANAAEPDPDRPDDLTESEWLRERIAERVSILLNEAFDRLDEGQLQDVERGLDALLSVFLEES